MHLHQIVAIAIVIYSFESSTVKGWLEYPENTLLQFSCGISMPVELHKGMKVFFNWAFLINYDLPSSVASFTNTPYWAYFSRQHKRATDYGKYCPSNHSHYTDATAGQIYRALEDFLISYGFHKTCLLKSVCEVAKHPFDLGDENLFAEIVNFVLSPSLHNAFDENEDESKRAYEMAEKYGASNLDCDFVYPDCDAAFINIITRVTFDQASEKLISK